MRIALHSEIREGAIDDYRTHHEVIPDELVATFARIGIQDWTIWRSGRRLFHMVECDDWDTVQEALRHDPADARWQANIGRYVELFRGVDGEEGTSPLEQVWDLRAQREWQRR
ncbi:L-rhamnose mutarotase [Ornithinimicrobium pratense]|uniref:L-rhamnose mutarotase n=1 Tax=Ornithinimicrobium pratense TaxID=2593973 RepID=A0A5J6V6S7_9MICO|nr:L-rhamnose mutarotase [Ornithinimicrobium pratense]QFG69488.1 L-rhamnose mutarotase [Ornithinimicrobium pratense]